MIRQVINVNNYWRVIVYYNIDYALFDYIEDEFVKFHSPVEEIDELYDTLSSFEAKAATCNIFYYRTSIVLFNKHKSYYDYINSIVHEAEHIKQSMLEAYDVEDYGEPPAYTIGYLAMKMFMILKHLF